jgi:hypothetical protein
VQVAAGHGEASEGFDVEGGNDFEVDLLWENEKGYGGCCRKLISVPIFLLIEFPCTVS